MPNGTPNFNLKSTELDFLKDFHIDKILFRESVFPKVETKKNLVLLIGHFFLIVAGQSFFHILSHFKTV